MRCYFNFVNFLFKSFLITWICESSAFTKEHRRKRMSEDRKIEKLQRNVSYKGTIIVKVRCHNSYHNSCHNSCITNGLQTCTALYLCCIYRKILHTSVFTRADLILRTDFDVERAGTDATENVNHLRTLGKKTFGRVEQRRNIYLLRGQT